MDVSRRDPRRAGAGVTVPPSLRRRRREVEDRLAAAGLLPGPHRLGAADAPPEDRVDFARRLAGCLAALGPTFTALGRYLGARADLLGLPAAEAMAAGMAPASVDPASATSASAEREPGVAAQPAGGAPHAEVEDRLERDLGAPVGDLFTRFAPRPVKVAGFVQAHDAQLPDGTPARVYLAVPGAEEAWAADLPTLAALARVWPEPELDHDALAAELRRHLEATVDARAQAAYLADAAAEAVGDDLLWLPRPVATHCGRRTLTLERVDGGAPQSWRGRPAEAAGRARDLVLAWLEQAFTGRSFAVDPRVRFLADGRPAFYGGEVSRCRPRVCRELAAYLEAVASEEPEIAGRHLRRALGDPPEPHGDLARHLRQRVTFQEGMGGDGLFERLMLHWRAVRSCGVPLDPEVDDFFRGLLLCMRRARRIDPGGDPLRDALEERRWRRAWREMVALAEPERLARTLEGYLATATLLPQGLERTLARLADPVEAEAAGRRPAAQARRPPGAAAPQRPAGALALLLVLAAVALVTVRLAPTFAWAEPLGGLAFLAVALYLLRPRGGPP